MSRLSRAVALPRRAAGALRRNGVRNVWRFGVDLLRTYGVARSLRYALASRGNREALLQEPEEREPPSPAPAPRAGDFAADGSVDPARWSAFLASRRPRVGAAAAGGADRVRVVLGEAQAPADADDADWIVLLQRGDLASPALAERVAAAGADPCVEVVSFDMTFAGDEERPSPVLQPGANPWLGGLADVGFGRYAFRARALRSTEVDGYARLRAWLAQRTLNDARDRWAHVYEPLAEVALTADDVVAARREAVARARAQLRPGSAGERVSVVVCTHDRGRLVRQLVRALDDPRIAEVVVVANRTTSPPALETLDWVRARPRCRVLVDDEPFNFSRMSNRAAALTQGDRLLFLNDDITPISDDWLEPLLQPLRDAEVGVTGPLLLYPDESVQHAGMFLGYRGQAGHSLRHLRLPEDDHLFYGSVPREVSAVTGAVMMVRRELFEALNGFDELLPTFLQDVDLCLRARAVGFATVWTPLAELLHMESTTIRQVGEAAFHDQRVREGARFLGRWGELVRRDPLRNPAFDVDDESQRTLAGR